MHDVKRIVTSMMKMNETTRPCKTFNAVFFLEIDFILYDFIYNVVIVGVKKKKTPCSLFVFLYYVYFLVRLIVLLSFTDSSLEVVL